MRQNQINFFLTCSCLSNMISRVLHAFDISLLFESNHVSCSHFKKAILRCFILAQDGTLTTEIQHDLYELSHCKWKTCCSSSSEAEIRARNRQRKAESSFPMEELVVIWCNWVCCRKCIQGRATGARIFCLMSLKNER